MVGVVRNGGGCGRVGVMFVGDTKLDLDFGFVMITLPPFELF